ncbi:Putative SOS response-associated peptidase YedK [Terribacillus aidingensis]|uniref:Abasic site processing protein n=1 Tax=Terribacillus aidingensis TaxID=586416 RepID=A0A285NWY5_9BACI|nr:SOS response-associated peptidase [Terribacillus aidingensis]SNZ14004.1 Putative SOS response-associated peptidase YedK [Terribacillus aidingensis]
MCGRFTLLTPWEELLRTYDAVSEIESLEPSYNIAPTQQIAAIIHDGKKRKLGSLRWGLIPPWAPDKKIGSKMINARAETLQEKRSFKKAFQKQRCLIPADSFYEWKTEDGKKQPMRIQHKDKTPFAFAGLWEKWQDDDGSSICTCTIITTEANSFMQQIHHRMPVILPANSQAIWLDRNEQDTETLQQILEPFSEELTAYPVSTLVNSPRNNREELINPL